MTAGTQPPMPRRNIGSQIARAALVLAFLTGAVLLWLSIEGRMGKGEVHLALQGFFCVLAAFVVGLRPWHRAWPLLLVVVLAYLGVEWIREARKSLAQLAFGSVALFGAGMLFLVLMRPSAAGARRDLRGAHLDRRRAIRDLEHLLVVEHGPGLARVQSTLEAAAKSDDAELAAEARGLLATHARLFAGAGDPPDESAMFPELPPTPAAGLGGLAPPAPLVESEAEQASELKRLLDVLREQDPTACQRAVARLAEIGDEAVPALEALAQDADPDVRIDAQRALDLIRGDQP